MISRTYRFDVAEIGNSKWTISAVQLNGGKAIELVGLYSSREAAEVNLQRVAQQWMVDIGT